jgi:hypothetical protein
MAGGIQAADYRQAHRPNCGEHETGQDGIHSLFCTVVSPMHERQRQPEKNGADPIGKRDHKQHSQPPLSA